MHISELQINNYRNFSNFKIDLHPFSLIIGENNSGKTNLLEALGLIFSQDITFFKKRILELDDINYARIEQFKDEIKNEAIAIEDIFFPEVLVEVVLEGMDVEQKAVAGDWFINKDLSKAKLSYLFRIRESWKDRNDWLDKERERSKANPKHVIDFPIKHFEYVIYGGGEPSNRADSYFLRMFKMELLDALRDASRELVASGDYRLLYKILNNRDEEKFSDIKDKLTDLQTLLDEHSELQDIRSGIEEYLQKISLQENDR